MLIWKSFSEYRQIHLQRERERERERDFSIEWYEWTQTKHVFYLLGSDSGNILSLPFLFVGLFVCLLDNFKIGHKFWTLSDRAFIFGMYVTFDKGFPLTQK